MKKRIRSILSFLSVILIVFSLSIPIFAFTVVSDQGYRYQPLWNLRAVEVFYLSGQCSLFNLPDNWYSDSDETLNRTIAIADPNDDSHILEFTSISISDVFSGVRNVRLRFSSYNAVAMHFIFDDTIIPFSLLNGDVNNIPPVKIENTFVVTDGSFNFGYGSFQRDDDGDIIGRRYSQFGSTVLDNLHEFNEGPPNISGGVIQDTGFYCLTPNSDWIRYLAGISPTLDYSSGLNGKYLHFFDIETVAYLGGYNTGADPGSISNVYIDFPIIQSELGYVPNFYDYIRSVFPGYSIQPDDQFGFNELGDFLSSTLGGFIRFEFMPGITIGDLFMVVIGVSLVILFLRFFAGG